jgi:toxin HigB-1
MRVASIRHKGLQRLWTRDESRGLPPDQVKRLKAALSLLAAAPSVKVLATNPGWRVHALKGDRKGAWSMTITGNWRLTFVESEGLIHDLDLEDYH